MCLADQLNPDYVFTGLKASSRHLNELESQRLAHPLGFEPITFLLMGHDYTARPKVVLYL